MRAVDVLIVGGGPAGSACAWRLRQRGVDCLVLDRAAFPRLKLCAGWVTPEALADLELDPRDYPLSFLTFDALRLHFGPLTYPLRSRQHSVRRVEFDAWLLERSGAEVVTHNVRRIEEQDGGYVIDGAYRCRWLVGAGGTRCPVYRALFREAHERAEGLQAAVLEEEFAYDWRDGSCHLWFFANGLPGYSWYVPKAGGHLNVGIGGLSGGLQRRGQKIKEHWERLTGSLARKGMVRERAWHAGGYTYYLRGRNDPPRLGNAFVVGDSAGLATRDLAEGIGPAIRSGLRAADAIAQGAVYDLRDVARYSVPGLLRETALGRAVARRGR
jgi:flavin-dependent dehydrogenase